MNTDTPTPRTDEEEVIAANFWGSTPVVEANFARQLERELITANQKLADLPADWSKDSCLETWFPFSAQELKDAKAATQWQPIETAPRDSEPIDIWSKQHGRLCNYQRIKIDAENCFYDPVEDGVTCVRDATHWKPIPPAPKKSNT